MGETSKHGGRRVKLCGMIADRTICYWCDAELDNAEGKEAIAAFLRIHPHECDKPSAPTEVSSGMRCQAPDPQYCADCGATLTHAPKPTTTVTSEARCRESARMFRVLSGWDITYDDSTGYENQCTTHPTEKRATVYTCNADPGSYFLHEILHIAIKAAQRTGKEGDETLVQDLVTAITTAEQRGRDAERGYSKGLLDKINAASTGLCQYCGGDLSRFSVESRLQNAYCAGCLNERMEIASRALRTKDTQ